jgi:hypothetical protein
LRSTVITAAILTCALAAPAAAQHAPTTFAWEAVGPLDRAEARHAAAGDSPAPNQPASPQSGRRILAAVPGLLLGTGVGLFVGLYIVPHRGGGDDPGLNETVWGGLIGGVVGTASAAGLPRLGDACRTGDRFARTLAATTIGGAISTSLIAATNEAAMLVTLPLSTIGGAVLGARSCRPQLP